MLTNHRHPSFTFGDYKVGIICALPKELLAIRALLDETHHDLRTAKEDTMHYSLGRMGRHLVATACLPSGEIGMNASSAAMQNMRRTFPHLESCLFVGIGGGIPSSENDIRLGDVVVSHPIGRYPAVVQYDMGKTLESGFETTGTLQPPPRLLMTAIAGLRSNPNPKAGSLEANLKRIGDMWPMYKFPGRSQDVLFAADSPHVTDENHCRNCQAKVVDRPERMSEEPQVFYGPIGSANQVLKNAEQRDLLWKKHKVLCVEMEAAGVMNTFSCLIIRGICDYADSHKSKIWQEYAAAAAAAYSKLLLSVLRDHDDISTNMGPYYQIGAEPDPVPWDANQNVCVADQFSADIDHLPAPPQPQGTEASGPGDPDQEQIHRFAILQALLPDRRPEEVLQESLLSVRRGPSWNPWPKDRESFQLFQNLSRWISDPKCSLLIVRGTPGRLLREMPDSKNFACSVIQFLRQKTDLPVIWALSPPKAKDGCVEPIKTIITQALPFCPNLSVTELSKRWQTPEIPTEVELLELLHDIVCRLPECFIVIELKHAALADIERMKNTIEQAVLCSDGMFKSKILIIGYDIRKKTSNSSAVQNAIMPSVQLRGSRTGWDPCWDRLTPRFANQT